MVSIGGDNAPLKSFYSRYGLVGGDCLLCDVRTALLSLSAVKYTKDILRCQVRNGRIFTILKNSLALIRRAATNRSYSRRPTC